MSEDVRPRLRHRSRAEQVVTLLAAAAILGHIFMLYRSTGPRLLSWAAGLDKIAHLLGFAVPMFLVLLAALLRSPAGAGPRRLEGWVVAAFGVHAVLSELIQHFGYSRRTGDPADVLADWLGVGLGYFSYRWVVARRGARLPEPPIASGVP